MTRFYLCLLPSTPFPPSVRHGPPWSGLLTDLTTAGALPNATPWLLGTTYVVSTNPHLARRKPSHLKDKQLTGGEAKCLHGSYALELGNRALPVTGATGSEH